MTEKTKNTQETLETKWGSYTLSMGWAAIPVSLVFLQDKLGLTPTTMNVLINLIAHWWNVSESPYPAQDAIAKRMGVSKRTIQRSMGELERLKLIKRTATQREDPRFRGRNLYDLTPLAETLSVLTPMLKIDIELRQKRKVSLKE